VALLVHILAAWLLLAHLRRSWARTLELGRTASSEHTGGGGGGREHALAYISLPAAPKPAPVPVPQRYRPVAPPPVPPVVAPRAIPPPVPRETLSSRSPAVATANADSGGPGAPGAGPGPGGGQGSGTGTGTGEGVGPGTGGIGGGGSGPEPRQLVLPPADYPKDLRGRQVEVTFHVTADGRVERIEVVPEIKDGGFARRFADAMRNYRFRPARAPGGAPVPGTTTVTVFF